MFKPDWRSRLLGNAKGSTMDVPKPLFLIALMGVALVVCAAATNIAFSTKESAFVGGYVWRYGVQPPPLTINSASPSLSDLKYVSTGLRKAEFRVIIKRNAKVPAKFHVRLPEIRRTLEVFGWDLGTLASVVLDAFSVSEDNFTRVGGDLDAYVELQSESVKQMIKNTIRTVRSATKAVSNVPSPFKRGFATMLFRKIQDKSIDPKVFKKLVPLLLGFYYFEDSTSLGNTNSDLYRLAQEIGWEDELVSFTNAFGTNDKSAAAYAFLRKPTENIASAINIWSEIHAKDRSIADFILLHTLENCSSALQRVDKLVDLYQSEITEHIRHDEAYDWAIDSLTAAFYENDQYRAIRTFCLHLAQANLVDEFMVFVNFADRIDSRNGVLSLADALLTEGHVDRFVRLDMIIKDRQGPGHIQSFFSPDGCFSRLLRIKSEFMQGNFVEAADRIRFFLENFFPSKPQILEASDRVESFLEDFLTSNPNHDKSRTLKASLEDLLKKCNALIGMKYVDLSEKEPVDASLFVKEFDTIKGQSLGLRLMGTLTALSDSNRSVIEYIHGMIKDAMKGHELCEKVDETLHDPDGAVSKFYPAMLPLWDSVRELIDHRLNSPKECGVRIKESMEDAATAAEKAGRGLGSIQSEIPETMGLSGRDSAKRIEAVIAQIAPSKGSAPLSLDDFLRDIQQIFNRSTLTQVKEALEELPDKVREQGSLDSIIREYGASMQHGAVLGKQKCQLRFASDEGELEAKYRDFENFFKENAGKLDVIKERAEDEHFYDTELEGIKSEMMVIFETLKRLEAQNQMLADLRNSEAVLSSETIKEKEAEVGRLQEQNLKYQKSNEGVHKLQQELRALRACKGVPRKQFVKLQSSLQKAQEERDVIKADVKKLEDIQKQLDAAYAIRETLEKSRAEMEKNCYCLPPRTSKADHRQDTLMVTASLGGAQAAASGRETPGSQMEVCRTRIGEWIESFGVWMRDRSSDAPTDPPAFPEKCFQYFSPGHFQRLTPLHAAWLPMKEMTAEQFQRTTLTLLPYLSFADLPRYDGTDPQHPCSVITSDHLSKMHQSSCLMVKEICHQKGILSYLCH